MILGQRFFVTPSRSAWRCWRRNADAGARLSRRARRHRPLDADQPGGRPGGAEAGHPLLRDADRLEVLRQPARCRQGDAVRRGELRHRLQPRPREGRAVGGAVLAERPGGTPAVGRRDRPRPLADVRPQLLFPPRLRGASTAPPPKRSDGSTCATMLPGLPGKRLGAYEVASPTTSPTPIRSTAASTTEPGHPHRLRRRLAHRLPAVGHRHRGAPRCASMSSATSPIPRQHDRDTQEALADLIAIADDLAEIDTAHRPDGADRHHLSRLAGAGRHGASATRRSRAASA